MESWIESGRLVEFILVATLIEGLGLLAYRRATGRGIAIADFAPNLFSGMALLVALREALVGAWWGWIAACLTLAFLAHLGDLGRRWVA